VRPVSAIILPPPRNPDVTYRHSVPVRHESYDASGLTFEVRGGKNVFDIFMTSRE
jgi:hypothetical protein